MNSSTNYQFLTSPRGRELIDSHARLFGRDVTSKVFSADSPLPEGPAFLPNPRDIPHECDCIQRMSEAYRALNL